MKRVSLLIPAALCSCALSSHETTIARTPSPQRTPKALADLVQTTGPIEFEAVVSARWNVPLSGILNLEHPKAKAEGLEDRDTPIVLPVFVLRHPEGTYIVDTGITRDRMNGGRGGARTAVEFYVRDIEPVEPLADILERQPGPLVGVLLTHMHVDHVLGIPDVPMGTPIYTGPSEVSTTHALHMFLRTTYDNLLDGRPALREFDFARAPTVGPIEGAIDIIGDGSLWALSAPGHTRGSTAYLANTTDGPVLMVGDTSHTRWGWDHGVTPGNYSADLAENARSLDALRALVAAHPEVRVFVGHEMPALGPLKPVDEAILGDLSMGSRPDDVETDP